MTTRVDAVAGLCKALADPTRLRILALLAGGEVCVCDIHEALSLTQPKVSRHLAYLRRAGLVTARRDGLWMHYRLAPGADPVLEALVASVAHALTHVAGVRSDAARLERRTGACCPPPPASGTRSCCGGASR